MYGKITLIQLKSMVDLDRYTDIPYINPMKFHVNHFWNPAHSLLATKPFTLTQSYPILPMQNTGFWKVGSITKCFASP